MAQAKVENSDRDLDLLVERLVEERFRKELGSLDERVRHILDSQSESLDDLAKVERIEVSPFIQLENEFGSPIMIRKSAIVGFKVSASGPSFQEGVQTPFPLSVLYTTSRDFVVRHGPADLLEALGQAEL